MTDVRRTRVNKYLSEVGYCSRRAADTLIEQGRVTVNGAVPEKGTKVTPADVVRVDGRVIRQPDADRVYIAFHKPVGIVCTTDTRTERHNIIDFINHPTRIFPIGRLDKPSEGLIFLTNDGDIVNKILRVEHNHEKEYVVTVDRPLTPRFVRRMAGGIPMLGTVTRECVVQSLDPFTFRIVLTQGLNRQIRRMVEYLGYSVTRLRRVRIMNVELDLPVGHWRDLTQQELAAIRRSFADAPESPPPPGPPPPQARPPRPKSKVVLFNKPFGVLSQFTSKLGMKTLADHIDIPGVYAAGRLDKDSEGLLLLTDDGALQDRIASPRFKLPKTYWAQVEGVPTDEALARLRDGIDLKDGRTRPAHVRRLPEPDVWARTPPIRERKAIPTSWIELQITEGRNRQVRRMTAAAGYPTLRLIRYSIGDWTIDGIASGESVTVDPEQT